MTKALDLIGKKFERLLVLSRADNNSFGQTRWNCICDCGGESVVVGSSLMQGKTKSCGCYNKDMIGAVNRTHGHNSGRKSSKTRNSWRGMKERCTNPKNSHYLFYGARGIGFPDEWAKFENFLADMGERPEGMTLERIDVNLSYSKENCKWDTLSNQAYNITLRKDNPSGKTGVRPSRNGEKWNAYIRKENKSYFLGSFSTFEEAIEVREKAELEMYGFNKT